MSGVEELPRRTIATTVALAELRRRIHIMSAPHCHAVRRARMLTHAQRKSTL